VVLATHHGLLAWQDGKLLRLGNSRDDFMGFSMYPHQPSLLFSSGHPSTGGNLGVLKSEDGGQTFRRVYSGPGGRAVDFHSMAVSPADPDVLYGWFNGQLYRSEDGANRWDIESAEGLSGQGMCWGAPCLSADSRDAQRVYAGLPGGLFVSEDGGRTFELVSNDLGGVGGVGVSLDGSRLFVFSQAGGVAVSEDGGGTFEYVNEGLSVGGQEIVYGFAFDPDDRNKVFLATTGNQLYVSEDGGLSWTKLL
jgi:photosystem II stability/assembly factor-like uncharacterized protein